MCVVLHLLHHLCLGVLGQRSLVGWQNVLPVMSFVCPVGEVCRSKSYLL